MLSEEQRAELLQQFGAKTVLVDKEEGAFVFCKPKSLNWEKCIAGMMDDGKAAQSKPSLMAQLCRECLVFPKTAEGKPDLAKLALLFEEYPAISTTIFADLSDLAGGGRGHTGKL